jgi:hypothetical protein
VPKTKYFAVARYLNYLQYKAIYDHAIAQIVGHQFLHGGLGSIPDRSVCGLWWTEWHCDSFFFLSMPVFCISIIVAMLHIRIHSSAICAVKSWMYDSIAK